MDQWAESDTSSRSISKREKLLQNLLKKATNFYEETIGILSGVFRLSEFVSNGSPEQEFYTYVVKVLIEESKCENASIFMLENGKLTLKAAAGSHTGETNKIITLDLGQSVAGKCVRDGVSILVSDVSNCEFFVQRSDTKVKIGSMLCLPIMEGYTPIGVLNLSHSRNNFFQTHDVRMFELLGNLVGQMVTLIGLFNVFRNECTALEKRVQQQDTSLRNISATYKAVVDASEEMIILLDHSGITFINQALNNLLESVPRYVSEIFDNDSAVYIGNQIAQLGEGQSCEFDLAVSLGKSAHFICQFFIKRLSVSQVLILIRDITLKRQMEQRNIQTEKLTSLGLLTSGIAHELNNKLTPILGFADLINISHLDAKDQKRFAVINNSANSAKKIVESLLTFSRNLPPEKIVFNMREIIDRTINLYKPTIKKRGIKIMHEVSSEPLLIKADMNCMEQVMVNLINNAIDAIGDQKGNIVIQSFVQDDFIHIHIKDSGCGIPNEVMPNIFDPFFTTKSREKGTGLGLSICYGIIADHRGEIFIDNTGQGALVRLKIPAMASDEDKMPQTKHIEELPRDFNKTPGEKYMIMIVEDEQDLLDLMVDALEPYYKVRSFMNGREAYDNLESENWELIISDLRMPEMDGMEFYRETMKISAKLASRFIFTTGDTYDIQVKNFLEETGAVYIKKPFRITELREIVREHINQNT